MLNTRECHAPYKTWKNESKQCQHVDTTPSEAPTEAVLGIFPMMRRPAAMVQQCYRPCRACWACFPVLPCKHAINIHIKLINVHAAPKKTSTDRVWDHIYSESMRSTNVDRHMRTSRVWHSLATSSSMSYASSLSSSNTSST